jgi:hypothetical protein
MWYVKCSTYIHCTEIIKSPGSDREKYSRLTTLVDGGMSATSVKYSVALDNFTDMNTRLQAFQIRLASLARLPRDCCSLCSAGSAGGVIVSHGLSGCPRIFNHCFKCIGKHPGSKCSSPLFKVPKGFCWTCWMPLQSFFGFTFHSECVGSLCRSPAKDVLKHLAIIFFNNRSFVPTVACTADSPGAYGKWLFETSESVAGEGQVPNILRLFMAFHP